MSNDGTPWHSDDELASALERALEIPTEGVAHTASNDFSELFAALTESPSQDEPTEADAPASWTPPAETPSVDAPVAVVASEQVFESLDDFKPRSNFIPVINSDVIADAEVENAYTSAIDEVALEADVVTQSAPSASVPVTSAHVTQPIQWDRKRPTFDEIIFGTPSNAESN